MCIRDRFIDFVKSPYFNKKNPLILFCQILADLHPNFNSENVDKEVIHNKMFPNIKFDGKQLSYMQSDLTKLCLKFMQIRTIEEIHPKVPLIKALANRKLHQLFQKESDKLGIVLENSVNKGANHYKHCFEFYDTRDQYFISQNERKDDLNAHLASENLSLIHI